MVFRTKLTPLGGHQKTFKHGEIIIRLDLMSAEVSTSQVIEYQLPKDKYLLKIVGGGGGDGGAYGAGIWYGSGGSGAAFVGIISLSKGTYRFTGGARGNNTPGVNQAGGTNGISSKVEKLNDNGTWELLIEAGGGFTGVWLNGPGDGGKINVLLTPVSIELMQNGNPGNKGGITGNLDGGTSVYAGYGQGCGTYGRGGTGGLIELSAL